MDENYQCLKDEAYKTKQALENAFTEKETQKAKLEATYKLFDKTDDEIDAIFLEIESDRKNTGVSLNKEYNDAYWKWKDADEVNEKAQTLLKKYDENYNADIPDVMIELKEVKQQNEEMQRQNEELKNELQEVKNEMKNEMQEVKKEMQEMKAMLPQMMMQQNEEVMKILNMLCFHYDEEKERLYQYAQPFTGNRVFTFPNGDTFEGDFQNGKPHQGKMILANGKFYLLVAPAFNGQNKEVDIVFPEPVEARYITFKPKAWNNYPHLRCEVYVDNVLQNTPLNQRSFSSSNRDCEKDSTMNAQYGWQHKAPYNANEWLTLDLQQRKTITGIRVGSGNHNASRYLSNLALEFGN